MFRKEGCASQGEETRQVAADGASQAAGKGRLFKQPFLQSRRRAQKGHLERQAWESRSGLAGARALCVPSSARGREHALSVPGPGGAGAGHRRGARTFARGGGGARTRPVTSEEGARPEAAGGAGRRALRAAAGGAERREGRSGAREEAGEERPPGPRAAAGEGAAEPEREQNS